MTTRAIQSAADTARLTLLEDCENKIKSAFRRGLEATCSIAKELHKIRKDELYTAASYTRFDEYLQFRARMDDRTFRRIVNVSQVITQLQQEGLQLPENETQAAELSRLDVRMRPTVWSDLLLKAEREEKQLTTEDVRRAVEIAEQAQPEAAQPRGGGGIEVQMEINESNGDQPVTKTAAKPQPPKTEEGVTILSEKGEAALNRIRKICGDLVAEAIEDGTKALTEREIKAWADCDDELMRSLTYYVIDRNWPLSKAVSFAQKEIQGTTDVDQLILIASARGGTCHVVFEKAEISVKLTGA
jgi:hypothetical protein